MDISLGRVLTFSSVPSESERDLVTVAIAGDNEAKSREIASDAPREADTTVKTRMSCLSLRS